MGNQKKFRGKSQGKSGKGKGNGNKTSTNNTPKPKTKLKDFVYYLGNATKAADYEQATAFIINHLKQKIEYDSVDITNVLEILAHVDFDALAPQLEMQTTGTDEEKARKNQQYEIDYEQNRKDHSRRVKNYKDNCSTSYSILWERCHANLIEAIENEAIFESKIKNDPVEC
jgi:hypothetical protein